MQDNMIMNDQKIQLKQFTYSSDIAHRTLKGNYIGAVIYLTFALVGLVSGSLSIWYEWSTKGNQLTLSIGLTIFMVFGFTWMAYQVYNQSKDLKIVKVYEDGIGVLTIRDENYFISWLEITKLIESAPCIRIFFKNHRVFAVGREITGFDEFRAILLKNAKNAKYKNYFRG